MTDVLSLAISFLSNWFLLLGSIMVGSFGFWGQGWMKTRSDGEFIKFWDIIRFFLLFSIVGTIALMTLSSIVEGLLYLYATFLIGITFAFFGVFFLWLVYTFDFDITTQRKWVIPVICFGVLALNIVLV